MDYAFVEHTSATNENDNPKTNPIAQPNKIATVNRAKLEAEKMNPASWPKCTLQLQGREIWRVTLF